MPTPFNCAPAQSSATACRADNASAATADTVMPPAAGSVIQRGIFRSIPSAARTVIGSSRRRGICTASSSLPASGWYG